MADGAVVEHPILTKMRNTRNGNILSMDTSMKTTERPWIQSRSERASIASWRSWMSWELVNRATVRRLETSGQHDGAPDGKVMQCAVGWCATVPRRNRSQCTRGYTRTSCSEDPADTLSNLLALCRDGRLQCGVLHAHDIDRRSVCGVSSGVKLADGGTVWRLRRALNGLRCSAAAFQAYLRSLLEDAGLRRSMAAPSIYNREDDSVKMSGHVDDPLVIGPEGPIRILFESLGQHIAVKGLETFDSVRGPKFLGMVYCTIPGGYMRQLLQGTSRR